MYEKNSLVDTESMCAQKGGILFDHSSFNILKIKDIEKFKVSFIHEINLKAEKNFSPCQKNLLTALNFNKNDRVQYLCSVKKAIMEEKKFFNIKQLYGFQNFTNIYCMPETYIVEERDFCNNIIRNYKSKKTSEFLFKNLRENCMFMVDKLQHLLLNNFEIEKETFCGRISLLNPLSLAIIVSPLFHVICLPFPLNSSRFNFTNPFNILEYQLLLPIYMMETEKGRSFNGQKIFDEHNIVKINMLPSMLMKEGLTYVPTIDEMKGISNDSCKTRKNVLDIDLKNTLNQSNKCFFLDYNNNINLTMDEKKKAEITLKSSLITARRNNSTGAKKIIHYYDDEGRHHQRVVNNEQTSGHGISLNDGDDGSSGSDDEFNESDSDEYYIVIESSCSDSSDSEDEEVYYVDTMRIPPTNDDEFHEEEVFFPSNTTGYIYNQPEMQLNFLHTFSFHDDTDEEVDDSSNPPNNEIRFNDLVISESDINASIKNNKDKKMITDSCNTITLRTQNNEEERNIENSENIDNYHRYVRDAPRYNPPDATVRIPLRNSLQEDFSLPLRCCETTLNENDFESSFLPSTSSFNDHVEENYTNMSSDDEEKTDSKNIDNE